jgi:hypothetical protein
MMNVAIKSGFTTYCFSLCYFFHVHLSPVDSKLVVIRINNDQISIRVEGFLALSRWYNWEMITYCNNCIHVMKMPLLEYKWSLIGWFFYKPFLKIRNHIQKRKKIFNKISYKFSLIINTFTKKFSSKKHT